MGLLPEPEPMSGNARCAWRLGWIGWLMGVVFTGAGALILSFGPEEMAEAEGIPVWFAYWMGCVFGVPGLFMLAISVFDVWRRKRLSLNSEAWRSDHRWNPDGARSEELGSLGWTVLGFAAAWAFLIPFTWFARSGQIQGPGETMFKAITYAIDAAFLLGTVLLGYRVLGFLKYGRSFLQFMGRPYRPGGALSARFSGPGKLAESMGGSAELRCVEERWVDVDEAGGKERRIEMRKLFSAVHPIAFDPTGGATLHFDVPPDAPSTRLSMDPYCYWEIVVSSEAPGIDYEGIFLVPVYSD